MSNCKIKIHWNIKFIVSFHLMKHKVLNTNTNIKLFDTPVKLLVIKYIYSLSYNLMI